jgi:hypothetical protein
MVLQKIDRDARQRCSLNTTRHIFTTSYGNQGKFHRLLPSAPGVLVTSNAQDMLKDQAYHACIYELLSFLLSPAVHTEEFLFGVQFIS